MALNDSDWAQIYEALENSQRGSEISYGKILAVDKTRLLIKVEDFGDQWIPLVGFRQTTKVYDDNGTNVKPKTYTSVIDPPKVGEIAVVLRQFGSRRLPKCVGVILSKGGWVG
jgi:hypothetical protein